MIAFVPLAFALVQASSSVSEGLANVATEVGQLRSQVATLAVQLRQRDERIEAMKTDLHGLRDDVLVLRRRPVLTPPVAGPFLSGPPASSDAVGVSKVAVFAPRVEAESPRRHDVVTLRVRRVEADSVKAVGDAELTQDAATIDLPLDQNGALYIVEWSTSEGHSYNLVLRDGTSGLPAASVQVKPLQSQGRFIFVGYRVE
jgi:hypothetical protein